MFNLSLFTHKNYVHCAGIKGEDCAWESKAGSQSSSNNIVFLNCSDIPGSPNFFISVTSSFSKVTFSPQNGFNISRHQLCASVLQSTGHRVQQFPCKLLTPSMCSLNKSAQVYYTSHSSFECVLNSLFDLWSKRTKLGFLASRTRQYLQYRY